MKKTLIKMLAVLVFMYFDIKVYNAYHDFASQTYKINFFIALLLLLMPGFICGLILNYDLLMNYLKRKKKLNLSLMGVSVILIVIAISPYLAFPLIAKFINMGILMSQLFVYVLTLMAGYCFSSAFSGD